MPAGSAAGNRAQRHVAEHQHRVVVAHRGAQQAQRVGRVAGHHHLQPRRLHEHCLQAVVVLAADAPAAAGLGQHHQRKAELTARQVAQLAGAVDQRVHRQRQERREQQVDHRPQAHRRGADGGAGDHGFGQRRVAHARRAVRGQQVAALGGHAFAEHQHAGVALHLVGQRAADRIVASHRRRRRHDRVPFSVRSVRAGGGGRGASCSGVHIGRQRSDVRKR